MKPAPNNCTIIRYDKERDITILVRPFRRAPKGYEGCHAVRLYPNGTQRAEGITVEQYNYTRPGMASPRGSRIYSKLKSSGVYTRYRATPELIAAIEAGGVLC